MNKTEFKKVQDWVTNLVNKSHAVVKGYKTLDLSKTSMQDYNKLVNGARSVVSQSDVFLKNDLYHLLGMGKLSAVQTSFLTKAAKELGQDRTIVKTAASMVPCNIVGLSKDVPQIKMGCGLILKEESSNAII